MLVLLQVRLRLLGVQVLLWWRRLVLLLLIHAHGPATTSEAWACSHASRHLAIGLLGLLHILLTVIRDRRCMQRTRTQTAQALSTLPLDTSSRAPTLCQ